MIDTTERNKKIISMKNEGKTNKEISAALSVNKNIIDGVMKRYRHNGRCVRSKLSFDEINERVDRYTNHKFIYYNGFTGTENDCYIKCASCGTVILRNYSSIRHGSVECKKCHENIRADKQEVLKRKSTIKDLVKCMNKIIKAKEKQESMITVICDVCGREFTTTNHKQKRCSKKCVRKHSNQLSTQRKRLRKIKYSKTNDVITLSELYQMNNGICYLCGKPTNMNDFKKIGRDVFCGNMYPSIDHVIPLSKGGRHEWGNVKLAHRICNSVKGDR